MNWQLKPNRCTALEAQKAFVSLDSTFKIKGEPITRDPLSEVIKVKFGQTYYYIKRYHRAGKHLRRFLGPSRIKTEWRNLLFFKHLGIQTADIIGYGEERLWGIFQRGAMITQELEATYDLKSLQEQQSPLLKNPAWVAQISQQIAQNTRLLHQHEFVHNDLKWRNILVTTDHNPQVFFIDCPLGGFWPSLLLKPFRNYRIIKDLACLDKVAKYNLRKSQRLAFYKTYSQCHKLTAKHKQQIRKILNFFNNRE